jgi:hypothetical protein
VLSGICDAGWKETGTETKNRSELHQIFFGLDFHMPSEKRMDLTQLALAARDLADRTEEAGSVDAREVLRDTFLTHLLDHPELYLGTDSDENTILLALMDGISVDFNEEVQ